MTDTMTSQNIDLSSWDTLYKSDVCVHNCDQSRNKSLYYVFRASDLGLP
jgi:hypothetical protein